MSSGSIQILDQPAMVNLLASVINQQLRHEQNTSKRDGEGDPASILVDYDILKVTGCVEESVEGILSAFVRFVCDSIIYHLPGELKSKS